MYCIPPNLEYSMTRFGAYCILVKCTDTELPYKVGWLSGTTLEKAKEPCRNERQSFVRTPVYEHSKVGSKNIASKSLFAVSNNENIGYNYVYTTRYASAEL